MSETTNPQTSAPSTISEAYPTPIAIYAEGGIGARLSEAMHEYRRDYVFSPDDFADHEPDEFEALMLEDFLNGAFTEAVSAILQEAAQAMAARHHTITIKVDASAAIKAIDAKLAGIKKEAETPAEPLQFRLGDRVRKIKGASWQGRVVGFYTTVLTPIGCAVESEREPGSVQIYPAKALEAVPV